MYTVYFHQVCFDFKGQMRITFVSAFRFRVRNLGPDLGGRFGTFVFCVFFVEYTLDCRDKYKYLKPLWAKWSRYYFTSLGGALTGGHTSFEKYTSFMLDARVSLPFFACA